MDTVEITVSDKVRLANLLSALYPKVALDITLLYPTWMLKRNPCCLQAAIAGRASTNMVMEAKTMAAKVTTTSRVAIGTVAISKR